MTQAELRLGGSITALARQFRDGAIDHDALASLCERQLPRGTTALVLSGSTGEAPALRPEEHALLIQCGVSTARGRVQVIAGCGASATKVSMQLVEAAARMGAAALLCSAPPYVSRRRAG